MLTMSSVRYVEDCASPTAVEKIGDPGVVVVSQNPRKFRFTEYIRQFEMSFSVERMQVQTLALNEVRGICVNEDVCRYVLDRTKEV